MKKAQGLSMTTIIVAAICLIVLVVLIVIFTGNIDKWGGNVQRCKTKGGECEDKCGTGKVEIPNTRCSGNTPACCIEIFKPS